MEKAEYLGNEGCPQRNSTECKEYAGAQSIDRRETEETDDADLLERILDRDNLNKAYKRVKANKGAPGIDGMTVDDALPWLQENREELLNLIRNSKYKPQPERRKEIPKTDGGIQKLGIPKVVDRIIQQAIAQQLKPIYEPLFSDVSYGYRPNRSAQMAICKDKDRTETHDNTEFDFLGYTFKGRIIRDKKGRIQKNFLPAVSKKACQNLKDKIKAMELHKKSGSKIEMIAEEINPIVRGWMNYFGEYCKSTMRDALQVIQRRFVIWAMCKYKRFRGHRERVELWLSDVKKREPQMFAHWALVG